MREHFTYSIKPARASIFLLGLFLMLFAQQPADSIAIVISTGGAGWTVTIPAVPSPVAAAGLDFTTITYTSATNQTILRVNAPFTGGLTGWIVSVRRTYTATWGANLNLWIRRTNAGTGGTLVGPLNVYQQVTNVDSEFFRCNTQTAIRNIRCQLEIRNVSAPNLVTPSDVTSVIYTVTEF